MNKRQKLEDFKHILELSPDAIDKGLINIDDDELNMSDNDRMMYSIVFLTKYMPKQYLDHIKSMNINNQIMLVKYLLTIDQHLPSILVVGEQEEQISKINPEDFMARQGYVEKSIHNVIKYIMSFIDFINNYQSLNLEFDNVNSLYKGKEILFDEILSILPEKYQKTHARLETNIQNKLYNLFQEIFGDKFYVLNSVNWSILNYKKSMNMNRLTNKKILIQNVLKFITMTIKTFDHIFKKF